MESVQSPTGKEIPGRRKVEICALIPVYNEASHIEQVAKGCLKHVSRVYVVDDGSTDDSAATARKAGATVLVHPMNQGKGAALKTGFDRILREGGWDAVVVVDGDGQHDWNEIPRFVWYLQHERCDIVVGNRMGDVRPMPLRRKASNFVSSRVLSAITRQTIRDSQCGFRLIKVDVIDGITLRTTKFDTESEMLVDAAKRGAKIGNLPIATIYGSERSSVHPVLDTWRFIRLAARSLFQPRSARIRSTPERESRC
jgi:glycosyltransferase involved in cell wall biosynthesis